MKISYAGKKTVIKDNFKEYVEKRMKRLDKFFDDAATANVVVTNQNDHETVEVTIRSQGMFFRAERAGDNRQAALDDAVDVLQNQIARNKERLVKKYKTAPVPAPDFSALSEESPEPDAAGVIVKTKKFGVEVMDTEEAILQMNLLDHEFFMFRNGETGDINVIYRRHDGNYGLLEPDED